MSNDCLDTLFDFFVTPLFLNLIGEHPNTSPIFSPEHCVFGYSAASPLSEDEENEEVFSP